VQGAHRAIRALAATFLLAASLVVARPGTPAAAQPDEPVPSVSIALTSIDPALPAPGDTVTLTGKVTNISTGELSNLQAIFWRAPSDPILNSEALDRSLTWVANEPLGARLADNYQNIPSEADRTLKPGQSTAFTVRASVEQLGFPLPDGVYLIGVHVRGRTVLGGVDETLGRARVFLTLAKQKPANALQMTSVVVLSSRPSLVRSGVLSDDHLAAEIADGGRLDQLLDAADADGTSFAVDPELIEELRAMKTGYAVLDKSGRATEGAGQDAAARWLARFDALKAERDGFRLLYGSPDIAALVHSGQSGVLQQAEFAGRGVDGLENLPLLVLPGAGLADAATVVAAEDLHPAAIGVSDLSTLQTRPLLQGLGTAPIVNITSSATSGGPGPDPRTTPVHLQQRVLADTWLEATNAPAGATLGRVRLVTSAAQAKSADTSVSVPWIKRGTLSQLLRSEPATWDQQLSYSKSARAAELNANQIRAVKRLAQSYTSYVDLLANPGAVRLRAGSAVARAASAGWRKAEPPMRAFLAPQQDSLDSILRDSVEISANPKVTTVARQGVGFPITVKNTLPAPADPNSDTDAVRVLLTFTSDNAQRLTVRPVEVGVVRAGANFSGPAHVDAKANGTVRVVAQLTTVSGTPVGKPVSINVTVTQAGTTGWIIAVAAGIVLIGSTALRIRQVARERARNGTPPAGDDPLSSSPPIERTSGAAGIDGYPDEIRPQAGSGRSRATLDV
jgi:hypothetical protein